LRPNIQAGLARQAVVDNQQSMGLIRRVMIYKNMSIEIKKVTSKIASTGMTIFDPNFLRSGYCRKLYVVTSPAFKFRTECHRHTGPHLISLIEGENVRLATKEPDGTIYITKLEPCTYYYVPPNLPHQVDIVGRMIVETYSPSSSIINYLIDEELGKKVMDEDFFEATSSQDDSKKPGDR
jgi:hypothetical protein